MTDELTRDAWEGGNDVVAVPHGGAGECIAEAGMSSRTSDRPRPPHSRSNALRSPGDLPFVGRANRTDEEAAHAACYRARRDE